MERYLGITHTALNSSATVELSNSVANIHRAQCDRERSEPRSERVMRRDSHITVTVITALSIEVCRWCKTMPHARTPTYTCKSSSYAQAGLTAREDLLKMPAATVVCSCCGAENCKVHREQKESRRRGEEREEEKE
ncbi:hypothetical protein LSTR_LSTR012455 [Laodelphax striatellus]|uniref:Uncharacterized protein n=1 Tax=Laodelphax striatellus TaxID=195883 RepID=A0A482XVK7_LAOST|nr:hypothetical protein LSTR_LSTR012455 [Laodelphax striatellus]